MNQYISGDLAKFLPQCASIEELEYQYQQIAPRLSHMMCGYYSEILNTFLHQVAKDYPQLTVIDKEVHNSKINLTFGFPEIPNKGEPMVALTWFQRLLNNYRDFHNRLKISLCFRAGSYKTLTLSISSSFK